MIDDDSPAASKPIAINAPDQSPRSGFSCRDSSLADLMGPSPLLKTAAALTTMAMVISPPTATEKTISKRADGRSTWTPDLAFKIEACRNRLYGTTVVPIRPATMSREFSGSVGVTRPFTISSSGGLVMTAVVTNTSPMTATRVISARSTSWGVPLDSRKNATPASNTKIHNLNSAPISRVAPKVAPDRLPASYAALPTKIAAMTSVAVGSHHAVCRVFSLIASPRPRPPEIAKRAVISCNTSVALIENRTAHRRV